MWLDLLKLWRDEDSAAVRGPRRLDRPELYVVREVEPVILGDHLARDDSATVGAVTMMKHGQAQKYKQTHISTWIVSPLMSLAFIFIFQCFFGNAHNSKKAGQNQGKSPSLCARWQRRRRLWLLITVVNFASWSLKASFSCFWYFNMHLYFSVNHDLNRQKNQSICKIKWEKYFGNVPFRWRGGTKRRYDGSQWNAWHLFYPLWVIRDADSSHRSFSNGLFGILAHLFPRLWKNRTKMY